VLAVPLSTCHHEPVPLWYTKPVFTGLVEDVGTVVRANRRSDALVFAVRPATLPIAELAVGESICHDGTCLTVTEPGREAYEVLAGAETLARTTLGSIRVGTRLNLERALRVGDRLGGHWVTGHVDGTGELASRRDLGANLVLSIRAPRELLRYIVEKGSISVAGVSLTVNAVDAETFSVAIIPHTRDHTSLGDLAVGQLVNLETDILAKHVEKLLKGPS
jgi:riboflavin synthase